MRTAVVGLNGTRAAREAQGPWQGPMGKLPVGEAPEPELTTEPSPCVVLYQFRCQMSLLYSSIVLSDEKYPALAMLVSIIFFHLSRFS